MANLDAAFGLRPVRHFSGHIRTNRYYIPSTDTNAAVYVGGLVKMTGAQDTDGIPVVTGNVSTNDAVCGVVVAVEPVTRESTRYRENSTSRYVLVADDPNTLFEVQEDGNMTAPAGGTAQLTGFTSGSTVTGLSAIEIASSELSETGDTDDDVQIIRLAQRPDNATGTNAVWEVRLNNHQLINGATGV